ncbi:MAG: EI24 domain-containing protein [Paracoccaceae bacterium]
MIFGDFLKALGQLGDARFRRVLWLGIGLTLVLLFAIYAAVLWGVALVAPQTVTLPVLGQVAWVSTLISGASLLLMIGLSVFLMVPVASAFTSLFLDEVAQAVEELHYPDLPEVEPISWRDALRDTFGFLGILVLANLLALVLYLIFLPFAMFIFWGLNGYLLGREYFQIVAMRRLGRAGARDMARAHFGEIWLAGLLMAMPLSLPLINLFIPILGAATFTHLFHRLQARAA